MNVFYYYYSYQHDGTQVQEALFSVDDMFETPVDLQPVLAALRGLALDVDPKIQAEVMAFARQP